MQSDISFVVLNVIYDTFVEGQGDATHSLWRKVRTDTLN